MPQVLHFSHLVGFHKAKLFRHVTLRKVHSHCPSRDQLLRKVYARVQGMDPSSLAYMRLSTSGACWFDYFRPEDAQLYLKLQREHSSLLKEIDNLRDTLGIATIHSVTTSQATEYAQQSCAIELNPLDLSEAEVVAEQMKEVISDTKLYSISAESLKGLELPVAEALFPHSDHEETHIYEVRNHILVSRWITLRTSRRQHHIGLNIPDLRHICATLIADTDSIPLYTNPSAWGGRTSPGDYRRIPIQVSSNKLAIFPYPQEVPALMARWERWRHEMHARGLLHPLLLACQLYVYFVSVHPYRDGNGRSGRTVMQDCLLGEGYLPVAVKELNRKRYLGMIAEAQLGRPGDLVELMLRTEHDMLRKVHADQRDL